MDTIDHLLFKKNLSPLFWKRLFIIFKIFVRFVIQISELVKII